MIAPGPRGSFLLGSLPDAQRDPLGMFQRAFNEHGDVVRLRFGIITGHLISSPAGVNHVLAENNKNYGKQTRGFANLRRVMGNGLLTAEGDFWKKQRRLSQPAFHRQKVAGFAEAMLRAAGRSAERLAAARGPVDVAAEMMRVTLEIVGETLLGTQVAADADRVQGVVRDLLRAANGRISRLIDLPPPLPTRSNLRLRGWLRVLDEIVLRIIAERRREPGEDLISMLLAARDEETGESMTDAQLRDEAMTIFLAGHETTANALTWSFYLLSRYPAAARALRAELGSAPITAADLPRLPLLKMILEESMRLYPPAWLIARSVIGADEIDGYEIPAGSLAFVSPYVVHRHPRLWRDPEGFDPQRFTDAPPRGAYFPFGGGPRQCIGNGFAMMEAQLVLATIAQKVSLELVPGHPVELEPSITLRPRHGMQMAVRPAP
jgi:cytochrome P450